MGILECTRIAVVKVQALDRWVKDQLALDTDRRKGQQPTAVGFTPHVPKQAQWEAIYQNDQENSTPSVPKKKPTPSEASSHVPEKTSTPSIKQEKIAQGHDDDEAMTEENDDQPHSQRVEKKAA